MKTCTGCGQRKQLNEFHKHNSSADGLRKVCRTCRCEQVRAQRGRQPERHILTLMIQRCHNEQHQRFPLYGGRGISVCAAWHESFEQFLADVGRRPSPRHSIDRIDNNRGYEPGNVRWATQTQQTRNKRNNRMITAFGITKCAAEWAEDFNLPSCRLIGQRIDVLGWTAEAAVSTPSTRAA